MHTARGVVRPAARLSVSVAALSACHLRAQYSAPSVSAASMTPSLYLIASTDVPVTMGWLRAFARGDQRGSQASYAVRPCG